MSVAVGSLWRVATGNLYEARSVNGVLEALLEREPRNPLGALDELERTGVAS